MLQPLPPLHFGNYGQVTVISLLKFHKSSLLQKEKHTYLIKNE